MTALATREYLKYLKSLHRKESSIAADSVDGIVRSPWYLVAAVAFGASNRPEEIPGVFRYVHDELEGVSATTEQKFFVARRLREAIFKAGLLCGFSRVNTQNLTIIRGYEVLIDSF